MSGGGCAPVSAIIDYKYDIYIFFYIYIFYMYIYIYFFFLAKVQVSMLFLPVFLLFYSLLPSGITAASHLPPSSPCLPHPLSHPNNINCLTISANPWSSFQAPILLALTTESFYTSSLSPILQLSSALCYVNSMLYFAFSPKPPTLVRTSVSFDIVF